MGIQPIDEFPGFSFLLGDMHPHVLALPFVLLALAVAFNVLLEGPAGRRRRTRAGWRRSSGCRRWCRSAWARWAF